MKAIADAEAEERSASLKAKREAKKLVFDKEYDDVGAKGMKDGSKAALESDDEDSDEDKVPEKKLPGKGEQGQGKVKKKGMGWARYALSVFKFKQSISRLM